MARNNIAITTGGYVWCNELKEGQTPTGELPFDKSHNFLCNEFHEGIDTSYDNPSLFTTASGIYAAYDFLGAEITEDIGSSNGGDGPGELEENYIPGIPLDQFVPVIVHNYSTSKYEVDLTNLRMESGYSYYIGMVYKHPQKPSRKKSGLQQVKSGRVPVGAYTAPKDYYFSYTTHFTPQYGESNRLASKNYVTPVSGPGVVALSTTMINSIKNLQYRSSRRLWRAIGVFVYCTTPKDEDSQKIEKFIKSSQVGNMSANCMIIKNKTILKLSNSYTDSSNGSIQI